jgi:hypothetical protein
MAGEAEYLRTHAEMASVLRAAIREEELHSGDASYDGWTWDRVRAYPASLMAMVIGGVIRVSFKSNSQTRYLLVNRAATKLALAGVGSRGSTVVPRKRPISRKR